MKKNKYDKIEKVFLKAYENGADFIIMLARDVYDYTLRTRCVSMLAGGAATFIGVLIGEKVADKVKEKKENGKRTM